MRCPICARAELEQQPGSASLRGLLHRPDQLVCPECGSVAEHRKDRLRFVHIPSPYGAFAGPTFQQRLSPERAIQIGAELRHMVRHNEIHPESGGFSFGSGQAIWNNKGDCGFLYDNTGAEVSSRCY